MPPASAPSREVYAEHRPSYPGEAVEWLVGASPGRVLELGAGTGKLTESIIALGHDVVATDPSAQMLAQLRRLGSESAHRWSAPPRKHRVAEQLGRRRRSGAGVPLVRPRARTARDRAGAPARAACSRWSGTSATRRCRGSRRCFGLIGVPADTDVGEDPVEGSELFAPQRAPGDPALAEARPRVRCSASARSQSMFIDPAGVPSNATCSTRWARSTTPTGADPTACCCPGTPTAIGPA